MNKLIVLFMPLLLLGGCAANSLSDFDGKSGQCLPDVEDAYVYPPDKEFQSEEDFTTYYMLPDEVLKNTSTAGLIRSFLDFPRLLSISLTSSNASPIGRSYSIYEQHNSVQELEKRPDAPEALLNYYKSVCFDCFKTFDSSDWLKERRTTDQLIALQVLFTREKILSRYDHKSKQEIVSLLLLHSKQLDELGLAHLGELEVMTWIMLDDGYEPVVQHFSKDWLLISGSMLEDVISFAKSYIQ